MSGANGDRSGVSDSVFAGVEPGRKGEILDAALEVFGEHGYDGGSMREIAARVGVTEPAIYRHFPGKEALFIALMRVGAGRLRSEAIKLLDSLTAQDIRGQILAALADRRQAMRMYGPLLRTLLPAAARNERFLAEYRSAIVEPARAKLTEKATELDAAFGVPRAGETRDARVRALMALIVGYFVSSFVLSDQPDEAIADAALRVMGWQDAAG